MPERMYPQERQNLVNEVKALLFRELRETIPPSTDIMRDFYFEEAAQEVVDLCMDRVGVKIQK